MVKRFVNLFSQDLTIALRNKFHLVILFLAALMIVLIQFVIPEKVKLTPNELFYDASEGKFLESYQLQHGADKSRFYESKEALMSEVEKNSNSLGIIIEGTLDDAKFTIVHQGTESPEILNVLDATIEELLRIIRGKAEELSYQVEYLRPKAASIPFNKSMLPVMIVTEAVMLGFLLISVMVFQEKEEGSIRAYRVSPGRTLEYILSKSSVNVLLSLLYTLIMVIFTVGLKFNAIGLLSIILLSSLLVTLMGLTISVFFKSLQEFLFIGVGILAMMGLPMASYLSPSFTPSFVPWIPTYSILFGLREVFFSTGNSELLVSVNMILAVGCVILFALSWLSVRKKLMREGK